MEKLRLLLMLLMASMATASRLKTEQEISIEHLQDLPPLNLILNASMTVLPNLKVNEDCKMHFQYYLNSLIFSRPEWALRMFDASTKIPDSVASGAFTHLGNFDQCIGVRGEQNGERLFRAQYCATSYTISSIALTVTLATCVPGTCTPEDIQTILQAGMGSLTSGVSVSINPENCYTGDDLPPVDAKAAVMISVFALILATVISATIYDYFATKSESKASAALLSFSLRTNLPNLASTKHARNSIRCINGIRALSLCWIMIGHRFSNNGTIPLLNSLFMFKNLSDPLFSVLSNSYLGVDTFFYLSGFLVSYVFMADVTRFKSFNVFKFYVYRYIRLTTTYGLIIGYYVCLVRMMGYGPRWRSTVNWQMTHCDKYWWLNIIYLNNYIRLDNDNYNPMHPDADCVDQGWYLTVDMQLAWFAPLVLVPLWRWPRYTTRVGLPLLVLASCFAPFTGTYINEFPMTMSLTGPFNYRKYVVEMYWPTHMRATPYIGGIIAAYFMFKFRQTKINIPKLWVCVGWMACTAVSLLVVFGTAFMYDTDYEYDVVGAAFYSGFHRLGWAVALSWIVFACHHGYGGPINSILSWKVLLPMSRLSYCMFLTHYILLYFDLGQVRAIEFYGQFNNIQKLLSDLVMVGLFLAMPLHLCVEIPTIRLLKIFLKSESPKKIDPPTKIVTDGDKNKD